MVTPSGRDFSLVGRGQTAAMNKRQAPSDDANRPGVFSFTGRSGTETAYRDLRPAAVERGPARERASAGPSKSTAAPGSSNPGCAQARSHAWSETPSRGRAVKSSIAADLSRGQRTPLAIPAPIVPRRAPGAQTTQPRSSRLIRRHHTASSTHDPEDLKSVRQPTVSMLCRVFPNYKSITGILNGNFQTAIIGAQTLFAAQSADSLSGSESVCEHAKISQPAAESRVALRR
jgi:hypothetical protein